EVLEPAESVLDAVPQFVCAAIEAERLLAIGSIGNDGLRAAVLQPKPQFFAVVCFVAKEFPGSLRTPYQSLCRRTIMRFTASQKDGKKTAFIICDCVVFRIAPASRATNRLFLFPLFAPAAERCALICVESIICVWVDRPLSARLRN